MKTRARKPSNQKSFTLKDGLRYTALMAKHAGLESQIEHEARRPNPDTILIAELKKKKLKLKEEIALLQ